MDVEKEIRKLIKLIMMMDMGVGVDILELLEKGKIGYRDENSVAWTDGKKINLGKEFFKRDKKEKVFILMHELLHIKLEHIQRFISQLKGDIVYKGEKIKKSIFIQLVNIATDLSINSILKSLIEKYDESKSYSQFMSCPDALYPEMFNLPVNKSSEFYLKEIMNRKLYDIIKYQNFDIHENDCDKSCDNNNSEVIIIENDEDLSKIYENVKEESKKNIGKGDTLIDRLIRDIIGVNTLNWKKILKEDIKGFVKTHPQKFIKVIDKKNLTRNIKVNGLPAVMPFKNIQKNEFILPINIFVDTSGSIGNKELSEFIFQIKNICKEVLNEMNVYLFSDKIYYSKKIKKDSDIEELCKNTKTGGTSFEDIKKIYQQEKGYFVIFTDGLADPINISNSLLKRVVWIIVNNKDFKVNNNNLIIHIEV